jgi:hypothetical protein
MSLRRLALLACLVIAAPASADQRTFLVTSFDRVRIEGPYNVQLVVGGSPLATADGDGRTIDNLDIRVDGGTLVVRPALNQWAEGGADQAAAPVIRLGTPALRSATLIGGGQLRISGAVKAQQLDLRLTGSGALAATGIAADQLSVTLLGSGGVTLAGQASNAQLMTSGPGSIAAAPLATRNLIVRLDGTGETVAMASSTAEVTSTGLGQVTVYGRASCTVKALAGGPVSCGKPAPPPQP